MPRLNNSVLWIGSVVILISFILALAINQRLKIRAYMRNFFLFPLIGLLLSTNTILSRFFFTYGDEVFYPIQSLLDLLSLCFWAHFFLNVFVNKNDLVKIRILFVSTVVTAIGLYIFSNHKQSNLHLLSVMNICNTIFCIFFYYRLFKRVPNQDIRFEPCFWVIAGLFFYSSLSLPFYSLNDYIRVTFPAIAMYILAISNMMIIIMYFFFIKACICTVRLHREHRTLL